MLRRVAEGAGRTLAAPLVATGFLTILPVPLPASLAMGPMGWPVAAFPVVGAAIGALLAILNLALGAWLPPGLVAALLLAALLATTGAIHLDGLMDSFDGLFGGKDPADRLAIMKDSRIGSYGIAAAIALLLVEYSALQSLTLQHRAEPLVAALCLSRWTMAATVWGFPAATNSGLVAGLKPAIRWWHMAIGTLVAIVVSVGCLGFAAPVILALSIAVALLGGRVAMARIGGVTGDICGAVGELTEVTVLVAGVALIGG